VVACSRITDFYNERLANYLRVDPVRASQLRQSPSRPSPAATLEEAVGPIELLWDLPAARRILRSSEPTAPEVSAREGPVPNYTLRNFPQPRLPVEQYGSTGATRGCPAAGYVFGCQRPRGTSGASTATIRDHLFPGAHELLIKAAMPMTLASSAASVGFSPSGSPTAAGRSVSHHAISWTKACEPRPHSPTAPNPSPIWRRAPSSGFAAHPRDGDPRRHPGRALLASRCSG